MFNKTRNLLLAFLLMIITFLIGYGNVFASANAWLSCDSKTINVNGKTMCYVYAGTGTNSFVCNYSISGPGNITSGPTLLVTSQIGGISGNNISFYTNDNFTKNTAVVSFQIQGTKAGTITLKCSGMTANNEDDDDVKLGDKSVSITVNTTTTKSTTKKTSVVTVKKTTTASSTTKKKSSTSVTTTKPKISVSTSNASTSNNIIITNTIQSTSQEVVITNPTNTDAGGNQIINSTTSINKSSHYIYYGTDESGNDITQPIAVTTTKAGKTNYVNYTTNASGQYEPRSSLSTADSKKRSGGSVIDYALEKTVTTNLFGFADYQNQNSMAGAAKQQKSSKADKPFGITNLKVLTNDGYATVYEINGIYYATVENIYESVDIEVETKGEVNSVTIDGTVDTTRHLSVGKNLVTVRVATTDDALVYELVIIRDDGSGIHDTSLFNLEVVGYDINFDSDILEYVLYIPYTVNKLYVYGQVNNEDCILLGDGIYELDKTLDDNVIYVSASYGDIQTTQYAIHVKKTYKSIIPWIITVVLLLAVIGVLVYMQLSKKKLKADMIAQKDKEVVAAKKRALINESAVNIKVNGKDANSVGMRTVEPTQVVVNNGVLQTRATQGNKPQFNAEQSKNVMDHKVKPKYVTPQPMGNGGGQVQTQRPMNTGGVQNQTQKPVNVGGVQVQGQQQMQQRPMGMPMNQGMANQNRPMGQSNMTNNMTNNSNVKTIKTVPVNQNGPYKEESVVITQLNK